MGSNGIYAAAVDINGDKWFGTARGGVSQLSGTTWTRYTRAGTGGGLTDDFVIAAAIGADGTKWFGGFEHGGVSVLSGTAWTTYTMNSTGGGLVNDTVYAIAIDRQGGKWFAANGGVSVLSGTTWTTYTVDNTGGGLLDYYVNAVAIDLDGAKWFGTGNGVSVLSGTTWLTYTAANSGLVDNNVMAITIGADGTKWFGTGGGVSVLSGTTWTTYTTANSGLVSNGVAAIAIDADGNKWFGTNAGVSVLFVSQPSCAAPTIESVGSGNWSDAATWSLHRSPNSSDVVVIQTGHTIIGPSSANVTAICNYGILQSANNQPLKIVASGFISNSSQILSRHGSTGAAEQCGGAGSSTELRGSPINGSVPLSGPKPPWACRSMIHHMLLGGTRKLSNSSIVQM